jgi:gamma-carbonic anhydrase
MPPSVSLLG